MKLINRVIVLILGLVLFSFSSPAKTETFEFSSNGRPTKGKIFLPPSYETNKNLPVIYLIDFTEQQFKLATEEFQEYYDIFSNMASYVDEKYTTNTSRTFIGKGSEGGIVLISLFRPAITATNVSA